MNSFSRPVNTAAADALQVPKGKVIGGSGEAGSTQDPEDNFDLQYAVEPGENLTFSTPTTTNVSNVTFSVTPQTSEIEELRDQIVIVLDQIILRLNLTKDLSNALRTQTTEYLTGI